MTKKLFFFLSLLGALHAQELKIKAATFSADQKTGVSVFEGDVNIIKESDELNASKVTVHLNQERKPIKFIAEKDVSFIIKTQDGALYSGKAQKVVYLPIEKEYRFFKQVNLKQLDENKEIIGEEVVLKSIEGKAYAKGGEKEPVIMIFDLNETQEEKKDD
ncbi:MAG: lipopolysaccharide transport periplasmic protein LptA [Sulfurimonadaceae bacterium]